jgi:hypothetical protein
MMDENKTVTMPDGSFTIDAEVIRRAYHHLHDHHEEDWQRFKPGARARQLLVGHAVLEAAGIDSGVKQIDMLHTNNYAKVVAAEVTRSFEMIDDIIAIRGGALP